MITFKGILKEERIHELVRADTEGWHVVDTSLADKLGAFIVLLIPLLCGLKSMGIRYDDSIYTLFLYDTFGLILCFPIMFLHEILHALSFGKKAQVDIWFYKFGMITYCIEKRQKNKFLFMLLLPNILITLPISLILIFHPITMSAIFTKVTALMMLLIVMGAYSDIKHMIYIVRNRSKYHQYCISGDEFFCK